MGDIFREVDEELKQERLEKLWKRYGKFVIAAAVLIVVGVAGWKYWQSEQIAQRQAEGARYQAAATLLEQGKTEDAATAFAGLGANSSSGYGYLSRLNAAAIRANAGDAAAAITIYDGIAADGGAPVSMRNLATALAGLQALRVPEIGRDALVAKLQPLTAAGGAYRHIALEILAIAAQRAGDIESAEANYKTIVDDVQAPSGIRSRASQMLGILDAS